MKVELLYTAWNRLAYTKLSFGLLRRNTDWRHVSKLVVYDDRSEDGTREWLHEAGQEVPVPAFELRDGGWRSTGATMNDAVALCEAQALVKIDNDIGMPPGWLPILVSVAERNLSIDLLGMEAAWTGQRPTAKTKRKDYGVTPAQHIGGVGMIRMKAFHGKRPIPLSLGKNGRAGWTIWQHRYHARAGWVTPDLPVVQFDRIPDRWLQALAAAYVEKGWARPWDPYPHDMLPDYEYVLAAAKEAQ